MKMRKKRNQEEKVLERTDQGGGKGEREGPGKTTKGFQINQ